MPKAEATKLTTAPKGTLVRLWPTAMEGLGGPSYTGKIEGIVLGPYAGYKSCDFIQQTNEVSDTPAKYQWHVWRGHYDVMDLDDPNGRI